MHLPHIVHVARGWLALFHCEFNPVRSVVPPPLEPVRWRRDRALAVTWLLDCEDSNWGKYQQLMIGVVTRAKSWFTPPLGALWLEKRSNDFGYWIQFCAVSDSSVAQAMAEHWSLPSFHADIDVSVKRSKVKVAVQECGVTMLRFEMKRPGAGLPQRFPMRYYSRATDQAIRTDVLIDAVGREKSLFVNANVELRRHEKVEPLRSWQLHEHSPVQVSWYDSLRMRADEPSAQFRIK